MAPPGAHPTSGPRPDAVTRADAATESHAAAMDTVPASMLELASSDTPPADAFSHSWHVRDVGGEPMHVSVAPARSVTAPAKATEQMSAGGASSGRGHARNGSAPAYRHGGTNALTAGAASPPRPRAEAGDDALRGDADDSGDADVDGDADDDGDADSDGDASDDADGVGDNTPPDAPEEQFSTCAPALRKQPSSPSITLREGISPPLAAPPRQHDVNNDASHKLFWLSHKA